VDLLKDLAVPEAFLVAVDDLVVSDANASVAVLEETVDVVAKPLAGPYVTLSRLKAFPG
jgi:hypothetical protein